MTRAKVENDVLTPAAMEVFVDDPWLALRGSQEHRRRTVAILILGWRICGIDLSLKKGQLGRKVAWIGAVLEINSPESITITITAERLKELRTFSQKHIEGNVITVKDLRSYAGKVQSMASVLVTWRPFAQILHAAIQTEGQSGAPQNCVWTKQCAVAIRWIISFLDGTKGSIIRQMDTHHHFRRGDKIVITTDACPWGMGALLAINGSVVQYFAIPVTQEDCEALEL